MWSLILKFLFLFRLCQVNAINELRVMDHLKKSFKKLTLNELEYYEIEENALYTEDISSYFKSGPITHSFESTFYLDPKKIDKGTEFSLIHLNSNIKHFKLSVNISIEKKLVKILFEKGTTNLTYQFYFNNTVDLLDGKWHNIMYGLHKLKQESLDSVIDCWIDCNKLGYPIFDYRNGNCTDSHFKDLTLKIGFKTNEINQSIPIKISKMRFHGYPKMPEAAYCEDLDMLH